MIIKDEYCTAREASVNWNVTIRMISMYCSAGEIPGAQKIGNMWLIPKTAQKPVDRRYKVSRE